MAVKTEKLVRMAQRGDREAFVCLMEAHKLSMSRTALAVLHNEEDAADAIGDTVLTAFTKLCTLREPKYFKTWLTRVLLCNCYSILRLRRGLAPLEELPETGESFDRDLALDVGETLGLSTQVSHIGSMAGFGQMEDFLALVDRYHMNGLRVSCDCYPYYAFSTTLGSATYDPGWLERYHCGYDVVELCEGKYKGRRCTKEIFDEVRRDNPGCITVCYVMQDRDVDMAFRHPNVMLGSDGIMNYGQGHPRAAGSFLRLLAKFVRPGKLSLYDAIDRMTAMPARKLGLAGKGRLNVGADADVVVFTLEEAEDLATFQNPTLPGRGIDYVWIGGRLAARDCRIVAGDLGRSVRK